MMVLSVAALVIVLMTVHYNTVHKIGLINGRNDALVLCHYASAGMNLANSSGQNVHLSHYASAGMNRHYVLNVVSEIRHYASAGMNLISH